MNTTNELKPAAGIQFQVDRLASQLREMNDAVGMLYDKLQYMLREDGPTGASVDPSPGNVSPLSRGLAEHADNLAVMVTKIRAITDRIDL